MSEIPGPIPETIISSEPDSRFGDKSHVIEVMRSGEPHELGSIDTLYPGEIASHTNIVEIVRLFEEKYSGRDKSNNITEPVMIHYGAESPLLCIFKPYDGENESTKSHHSIPSYYPREVAGYAVSEHFKFDLVPPTTIREIGGRIGALQMFMEPPEYISGEKFFDDATDEEWDRIKSSDDFSAMAALDYLLGNTDRKDANYLLRVDEKRRLKIAENGQPRMVAIDHGLTLDTVTFGAVEIMGPLLGLTFDTQKQLPLKKELPKNLTEKLQDGSLRRADLDLTFLPDIPEHQIVDMWKRLNNLLTTGHFLSPENHILFVKK